VLREGPQRQQQQQAPRCCDAMVGLQTLPVRYGKPRPKLAGGTSTGGVEGLSSRLRCQGEPSGGWVQVPCWRPWVSWGAPIPGSRSKLWGLTKMLPNNCCAPRRERHVALADKPFRCSNDSGNGREAKGVSECQNARIPECPGASPSPCGEVSVRFPKQKRFGRESSGYRVFFFFLAKTCKGAGVPEPRVLERGVGREVSASSIPAPSFRILHGRRAHALG